MIEDIYTEFCDALNPKQENQQQCHLTYQQANQSTNELMKMILELKQEIKELKTNKGYNNKGYQASITNSKLVANWKYYWTHGCNSTHSSKDCRFPADNY